MAEHKEHPLAANIFIVLSVVGLLVLIYGYGSEIEEAAGSFLALTPNDIYTIPVAAIAFLVFWQLMHLLVFSPLVKLVESREASTEGAEEDSGAARQEALELQAQYDDKVSAARREGMEAKAKELSEAQSTAQTVLDKANEEAEQLLQEARERIKADAQTLRGELAKDADSLVKAVVEKIQLPAKEREVSQ